MVKSRLFPFKNDFSTSDPSIPIENSRGRSTILEPLLTSTDRAVGESRKSACLCGRMNESLNGSIDSCWSHCEYGLLFSIWQMGQGWETVGKKAAWEKIGKNVRQASLHYTLSDWRNNHIGVFGSKKRRPHPLLWKEKHELPLHGD